LVDVDFPPIHVIARYTYDSIQCDRAQGRIARAPATLGPVAACAMCVECVVDKFDENMFIHPASPIFLMN
jgi:hypothetical protein